MEYYTYSLSKICHYYTKERHGAEKLRHALPFLEQRADKAFGILGGL